MIGIVGAQIEEIKALFTKMDELDVVKIHDVEFYTGKIAKKKVVLVLCGIGKVASARITTLLIDHFPVTEVINIGTAGGILNKVQRKDVVLASRLAYTDADLTFFANYKYGQMAGCPRYFETSGEVVDRFSKLSFPIVLGDILSGDKFCSDKKVIDDIIELFEDGNIVATDMESTAVAHICHLFNKKFIVLRYISDIIGEANQDDNYETNLLLSSYQLANILEEYLKVN